MNRIQFFNENIPEIRLFSRKTPKGPESTLVNEFVNYYADYFLSNNKNKNLAVFVEPRIISGFPDVVFAAYDPKMLKKWNSQRKNLDVFDLKLLSFLIWAKVAEGKEIINKLKMPEKQTIISLEKLLDSKLITRKNKVWQPTPLKEIYGIKKLVSIEAKINNLRKVAEQSFLNTWFASQSYVLSNISSPSPNTFTNFEKYGIGLYCKKNTFRKIIEAHKFSLPSSYISLQFNEWIGNSIF